MNVERDTAAVPALPEAARDVTACIEASVARVTIDRPKTKDALTPQMWRRSGIRSGRLRSTPTFVASSSRVPGGTSARGRMSSPPQFRTQNELLNLRVLAGLLRGDPHDAMTSVTKLHGCSWRKKATSEIMNLLGASAMIVSDNYEFDLYQGTFLNSAAEAIDRGANQVQQNIIGERLLRLPRE